MVGESAGGGFSVVREVVESLRNRIVLRADKRNRVPLLYALVLLLFFAWLFFDDMIFFCLLCIEFDIYLR